MDSCFSILKTFDNARKNSDDKFKILGVNKPDNE